MDEKQSTIQQIKELVKEAYSAFGEFMRGLMEIKKEEREIITAAHKRADAKKLEIIKSKISKLK